MCDTLAGKATLRNQLTVLLELIRVLSEPVLPLEQIIAQMVVSLVKYSLQKMTA